MKVDKKAFYVHGLAKSKLLLHVAVVNFNKHLKLSSTQTLPA